MPAVVELVMMTKLFEIQLVVMNRMTGHGRRRSYVQAGEDDDEYEWWEEAVPR